jgi:hypothetical protein
MTLDTYGLEFDDYKNFFLTEAAHLLYLYYEFERANEQTQQLYGWSKVCEKTRYDLFSDIVYATNDRAREKQKKENPDAIAERTFEFVSPSKEEMLEEIKSLHAKIESLTDYVSNLTTVIKTGLIGLVETVEGEA